MKKGTKENKINFNENIVVPDIVNEKCASAFDTIRREASLSPPRIRVHHKKKTVIISIVVAAAMACSATAAATYFRSAYNFKTQEVYTKDPAEKIDLSPFATPVNDEKQQSAANITLQSVYCDGENLSIAFALTPNNEELKDMTTISAHISSTLNGESIDVVREDTSYAELAFAKADDGMFYETMYYRGLDVKDLSELEINIYGLQGINVKHQTWVPNSANNYYEEGRYEPDTTDIFSDKFNFKSDVKPDTSNNKLYEINETQDGITLENVLITPFKTQVSISGLAERQQVRIVDQNGEEFEAIGAPNGEPWENEFAPPLKTAKQLSVQIWDLDMDNFPTLYEFTFDIEKGFANKYDVEYDNSDIVYDPPQEVFDEYWEKKHGVEVSSQAEAAKKAEKLPVNTPVEVETPIDEMFDENGEPEMMTISWKITGSEIGDVILDDISEEHMEWISDVYDVDSIEDCKMLFVTYELTNMTDKSGSMYTNGGLNIYSSDFEFMLSEPVYTSYKDNGGKSSYKYDFEPNQTKTITYGYVVPENYADKDFYAVSPIDLYGSNAFSEPTPDNIESGKCQLMNIK